MGTNFTGSWKLDLSKSKFPGLAPRTIALKIKHSDSSLDEEMLITRSDGSEERVVFHCQTDGRPYENVLNGRTLRGVANWKGQELLIESWMLVGGKEMHFRDFWFVSADRRTLSMEHRDDGLAGQLSVFERIE